MRVVVVGGGPAGVTAALRSAELGAEVTLVERGNLGGTCTNDGCVPVRVLAKAARLVRDATQYPAYGLHGEGPSVDIAALLARTEELVYTVHEKKQLQSHLESAGVTVLAGVGEARFIDAHTLAIGDGQVIEADRIILCAGGHARRLPIPGAHLALTHSELWRLRATPQSLAIIGGAATGCQLASIFAAFGAHVTLFEIGPNLLGGEDPVISAEMLTAFTRRGIESILQTEQILGIEAEQDAVSSLRLRYRREGQEFTLSVEAVVFAAGWPGNVETLNLSAASVETERGYITVDDTLRTSAPHIYAAGDITGRMMLVQSAIMDGRRAAEHALGASASRDGAGPHTIIPHGGFTDPEYASVGLTEPQARATGEYVAAEIPYVDLDRAVIDGHTEGVCKLIATRDGSRLLGAHIVGEQAVEIVQVVAAGMTAGMRVDQLAALELAYPTYTAILGLAARRILHLIDGTSSPRISADFWSGHAASATEWERHEPIP